MRIAIMGSGGVGGYFGARLAKGGADVVFIARGPHLEAMRKHGLRIENEHEPIELPKVNATDDSSSIGRVDLILFAVKLWDTESAAKSLLPAIGPDTGLISFQNGVQKDDMLRPIVGEAALMGGVGYVATAISRPGVIAQTGTMQRLLFGEFDGRPSKRVEDFHRACVAGGINAEISPPPSGAIADGLTPCPVFPAEVMWIGLLGLRLDRSGVQGRDPGAQRVQPRHRSRPVVRRDLRGAHSARPLRARACL
ncbi:MAG: 2-dehydropantoate 2-reductase N-terminal domain-containing protein [Rhodoplanes sp.]